MFPASTNEQYRGAAVSAWFLALLAIGSIVPGGIHYFLPDGGAEVIAGLDLGAQLLEAQDRRLHVGLEAGAPERTRPDLERLRRGPENGSALLADPAGVLPAINPAGAVLSEREFLARLHQPDAPALGAAIYAAAVKNGVVLEVQPPALRGERLVVPAAHPLAAAISRGAPPTLEQQVDRAMVVGTWECRELNPYPQVPKQTAKLTYAKDGTLSGIAHSQAMPPFAEMTIKSTCKWTVEGDRIVTSDIQTEAGSEDHQGLSSDAQLPPSARAGRGASTAPPNSRAAITAQARGVAGSRGGRRFTRLTV